MTAGRGKSWKEVSLSYTSVPQTSPAGNILRGEWRRRTELVSVNDSKACTKTPTQCHEGAGYGRHADWAQTSRQEMPPLNCPGL